MNDYAKGALEALAWVDTLLIGVGKEDAETILSRLRNEVQGANSELLHGSAIDFRSRLRASWAFK
jgi:hypothetical protein